MANNLKLSQSIKL